MPDRLQEHHDLASAYAPVIRHEVNRAAPHKDFIVRFDFERPDEHEHDERFWEWRDSTKKRLMEHLDDNGSEARIERCPPGCIVRHGSGDEDALDLRAYVYYSVIQTRTHDFVMYAWYHPVDWKKIGSHSNDLEGAMVVAERESGRVVIVAAIEHLDINAGRLDEYGLPMSTSRNRENEPYLWYKNPRRPLLYVEAMGHGVWLNSHIRQFEPAWDGTIEYQPVDELGKERHVPPLWGDEASDAYRDRDERVKVAYELLPMLEPGEEYCLWNRFKDIRPDGSIGMSPPWNWTHSGDRGLASPGEWFLDPAFYYAYRRGGMGRRWGDLKVRDDVNEGSWDLRYTYNPFLKYRLESRTARFVPERGARMLAQVIDKRYHRKGEYFVDEGDA